MPLTNDDLQNFYRFALGVIKHDGQAQAVSIEELAKKWESHRERDSVHEAIRAGLDEIESGGGRPFDEFFSEMKAKYNLSVDA